MPSFDLVSKLEMGELKNAMDQANREISGRYDFKGSSITLELKGEVIELIAEDDYKMRAALDILRSKMGKRNIGMKSVEPGDIVPTGNQMLKQVMNLRNGIDKEQAKVINKLVKASDRKVTSAYLDEKVRITGKKIDDLQGIYHDLRNHDDVKVDLQMENIKK